jgi:hypothetical protein
MVESNCGMKQTEGGRQFVLSLVCLPGRLWPPPTRSVLCAYHPQFGLTPTTQPLVPIQAIKSESLYFSEKNASGCTGIHAAWPQIARRAVAQGSWARPPTRCCTHVWVVGTAVAARPPSCAAARSCPFAADGDASEAQVISLPSLPFWPIQTGRAHRAQSNAPSQRFAS